MKRIGKTLFGRLITSKKRGPYGALKYRRIKSGKNKGRNALWY